MEKRKLSEELKHCLNGDGCAECAYGEEKCILSCRQLLQSAYEKIKEYEDLEEQGYLLKLPCKVGDTVYMSDGNILTVREIHIQDNLVKYFVARFNPNGLDVRFTFDRIGKNIFLTQAEAEEALRKMNETEE